MEYDNNDSVLAAVEALDKSSIFGGGVNNVEVSNSRVRRGGAGRPAGRNRGSVSKSKSMRSRSTRGDKKRGRESRSQSDRGRRKDSKSESKRGRRRSEKRSTRRSKSASSSKSS